MTRPLMRLQKLTFDAAEAVRAGGASPRTGGALRPRPLVRRALAVARRIDRIGGTVAAARQRIGGRRLGEYVAAARQPKLLRAATRLAPAPQPRRAPHAPAPTAAAPRVEISREESPAPVYVVVDDTPDVVPEPAMRSAPEAEVARSVRRPDPPPSAPASVQARAETEASTRQEPAPSDAEPPAHTLARTPTEQPRMIMREPEPPPPDLPEDMHFLWNVWQRERPGGRGVLERSRGAKIVEGAPPEGDATPTPARKRLARQPAPEPPPHDTPTPPAHETPAPPAQVQTPAAEIARQEREPTAGTEAGEAVPPAVATPTLARRAAPAPEPALGPAPGPEPRRPEQPEREQPEPSHPHQTAPRVTDPPSTARAADTPTAGTAAEAPIAAVVPIRVARRPRADRAHDQSGSEPVRPRVRRAEVSRQRHLVPVPAPTKASPDVGSAAAQPQPRSLLARILRKPARADAPPAAVPDAAEAPAPRPVTVLARAEDTGPAPPAARVGPPPPTEARPARPIARARAKQQREPMLSRQFGVNLPSLPSIPGGAAGAYEARAASEAHAAAPSFRAPGAPTLPGVGTPDVHAPGAASVARPTVPSAHVPNAQSMHVPNAPSMHVPNAPSMHVPNAPSMHAPHMPSMPSAHGLPGLPAVPGAGHAAGAGPAPAADDASDHMYRELLSRLREEQEQLGQIVDEPF